MLYDSGKIEYRDPTAAAPPAGKGIADVERMVRTFVQRQHSRQQLLKHIGYTLRQDQRDKQRVLDDTRRILGR